jgi:hypothetical protein
MTALTKLPKRYKFLRLLNNMKSNLGVESWEIGVSGIGGGGGRD